MKTKPASHYHSAPTLSAGLPVLALAALIVLTGGGSPSSAAALRLANTGANTEALPTYRLDWDATSNSTYLVQSATDLGAGAPWTTLDAVFTPDRAGSYQFAVTATDPTGLLRPPATFYRLILPQPQISSVEPAIVPPGVAVDLYVLGQCFPTNAELQINGVTQTGTVYQSSSTLVKPVFTPGATGNYQVSLLVGGLVVSSFTVVCADPLANPELVLQGPPAAEPPASPAMRPAQKGKEKWKNSPSDNFSFDIEQVLNIGSQSSGAGAGKITFNPFSITRKVDSSSAFARPPETGKGIQEKGIKLFDDSLTAGFSAPPDTGKGINQKGLKLFDDSLAAGFEVAEGKKGLNAVNVKLARTAGGGVVDGRPWCWGSAFSGEVQQKVVDLAIPGRELDFVWARTYNSRIGRTGAPNGWTFSYDVSVQPPVSGACVVREGTGRADTFKLGTNGTYTCPEFFREGTLSNNTFTLTFADTGRWVFNPFDGTAAAGKLHQVITRNGSTMTLGYDTSGRLAQVVDDLGRTNTVSYNTSGQLASVTDFTGRSVNYKYYQGLPADPGGAGDLKSVTSPPVTGTPNGNDFPTGKITRYTYTKGYPLALDRQNHLLIACVDALGQTNVQFTYELNASSPAYLHVNTSQCGANAPTVCSFTGVPHVPVLPASFKCTVNDPVGNVTECYFDARGRCVAEREFTGRATPGTPVTNALTQLSGKLRDSDPDYFETQCTWNNDSLCTSVREPGHLEFPNLKFVYQSDFDPATPARKRADCRVVRELASSPVDLDGDGVADVTDRSWHFDYDPRFGSSECSHEWYKWRKAVLDGKVDRRSISVIFHNDAGEAAAYHAINTKGTGGNTGIADAVTFGREKLKATTKTQGDFNLSNRVMFEDLWPSQGDFDFNDESVAYNYCVAATDPRGNVTTGIYDPNGNVQHIQRKHIGGVKYEDFSYDTHGQLTAITNAPDANGRSRVDTFSWSQGQMTQCVIDAGAGGLALTSAFEYDARGNLTRYVDPRGNDRLFAYNSLDQPVESSSATVSLCFCKIKVDYFYDANDQLVQRSSVVLDPAGNPQGTCADNFRYDALQRLTECALAVDSSHVITNRYVYDANNQCVQALGPDAVSGADPHQAVTYAYDERGLLFHATTAPGSTLAQTKQFDYTASGKIKRFNVELYVEQMAFDGFDRPSVATDPMGNQTVCFYDANDNLRVARTFGEANDVPGSAGNVRLAESRREYDGLNRLYKVHALHFGSTQSPVGDGEATTTFAYAPNGACTSITDDLGLVTTCGYDTAGRSTALSAGVIAGIVVARDASGNVTSVTETNVSSTGGPAQVFACTYAYDALDRLVSCTDSAGNTSSCAYDSLGHVVRATDALGNDTTYAYDFMGDCLTSVSYAGSSSLQPATVLRSSSATYDSNLRCASATDANGNTTSYAYDTLGNCTLVTRPDGTHQQMVWSPRSNLMQATDPNGTVSVCTYDLNDRLVRRDITMASAGGGGTGGGGGGGAVYVETFSYDGCDRLTGETDHDCSGSFAYDSLDNCVSETLNGLTTSSTCDALGNRLSLTYPGGRVLTYAYDAASRCTGIAESGKPLATFDYTGSRLSQETCGNGVRTQVGYDGQVGTPNAAGDYGFGQVSQVRHTRANGSILLSGCKATWDQKQNKTTRTVAIPGAGGHTNAMAFNYDAVDQLVQSAVLDGTTLLRNTTYGFDRMGNRTNVTGAAACSGDYTMNNTALAPFDLFMNRYTTTPCEARAYDANGNLVSRSSAAGPVTYAYDYADRLVQVQSLDFSGGTAQVTTSTYVYDALGRRVSKTVSAGGLPPSTRQYCYDGTCAIEERVNGAVAASYVLQDCALVGMRQGTQDYFVHTDDQGNTLALTGANGAVVERYDGDDYGAVTFLTSDGFPTSATSSAVGNPYCWGGLRLDAETGLQNDDGGGYFESQSGRPLRTMLGLSGSAVTSAAKCTGLKRTTEMIEWREASLAAPGGGNNPWSGGGGGVFSIEPRSILKIYFETGDVPTQDRSICPGGTRTWPPRGYWPNSPVLQLKRQCLFNLGLKG